MTQGITGLTKEQNLRLACAQVAAHTTDNEPVNIHQIAFRASLLMKWVEDGLPISTSGMDLSVPYLRKSGNV